MDKGKSIQLDIDDAHYETLTTRKYEKRKGYVQKDIRKISAVIPGLIVQVCCETGQVLREGDTMLILEAMKMRNAILSPVDGMVRVIHVKAGEKVPKGRLLMELK